MSVQQKKREHLLFSLTIEKCPATHFLFKLKKKQTNEKRKAGSCGVVVCCYI